MAERPRPDPILRDSVPTVLVPDRLSQEAGISLAWSGDASFGLFPTQHVTAHTPDCKSQYTSSSICKDVIHHTRAHSILFDPIARKLVNESNGYFIFAQKLMDKIDSPDFSIEILKLSRQYRSVLRACLENLQAESETCPENKKSFYLQNIPTFYNMELIWHLCEIMFLDMVPGDVVLSHLITWIRFHVPQVEKDANKILMDEHVNTSINTDYASNYWIVVIDCLLQRRIDTVRSLLKLNSEADTEPFKIVDNILRTMPIFEFYGGLTASEFHVRYECWKRETKRLLIDGNFNSHKYLTMIVKILIGDESIQEVTREHCLTWYQHMVASLIYTEPTVKSFDLAFYANQSITRYGGHNNVKQLDLILCAIMEMDIFKMIERLQDWTERDWLPTHLTNLLYICDKLNISGPQTSNIGNALHERLLLNYGTLLMSHRSLWQAGVDYLDCCRTEGRMVLETLLSKIPFRTDAKALKIIHIAHERDLEEVVYNVSKVQGMRCLGRGDIGGALTWAMRCQDPVLSSQLADIYLKKYVQDGKFESNDLLQNLGSGILLSDRLAFLGRYSEFCQMLKAGDQKEAGALLVYMLVNKVPPKFFWLSLFMDAVPLLEGGKGLFSSQDIYDLMSCLQELVDESSESVTEKLKSIRTILAKNLAEALIREGTKVAEHSAPLGISTY
ncbi:hypothetical protein RUM43_004563 [Polyplax serrata]|uniref:Nuclear pore complex protein Nup85 n=1 Tax=Polyplax serrata TaxID=468196 RepID=A0AAN8XM35_POLSC